VVPGGVIPLTHTIFLWQSLLSVAVEVVVVTALMFAIAPSAECARTAQSMGLALSAPSEEREAPARKGTPGEWLEHAPWLSLAFVALALTYLVGTVVSSGQGLNALNLNSLNLLFLTVGVLLHGTPARLMRAVQEATGGIWGVVLQFPFYAGIAALMVKTHLNETIASWFVGLSTRDSFPALIALYSAALGVLVPSGGSKWVIEAPYVLAAAHTLLRSGRSACEPRAAVLDASHPRALRPQGARCDGLHAARLRGASSAGTGAGDGAGRHPRLPNVSDAHLARAGERW
jgi:short-chain fatty acids transporter